jgi:hypothetical protein
MILREDHMPILMMERNNSRPAWRLFTFHRWRIWRPNKTNETDEANEGYETDEADERNERNETHAANENPQLGILNSRRGIWEIDM